MKRILPILLILGLVVAFSACQSADADVRTGMSEYIVTTEKSAESTTKDEEVTSAVKTEEESTYVETDDSNEETTKKTDINKDETTGHSVTDYIKIYDNKVETPAYELEIPDDFEVKSDDEGLLLENKKGTIQFNIMDKTDVVTDFEAYVSKTHSTMVAVGAASDEIQNVVINGFNMRRFSMTITEEENVLDAYCYLAQINGRTLVITLTSKDGGLTDVAVADAFVSEIQF